MRSFWSDPYLWVHLAGIASLPIWLELCVVALGSGEPFLPLGLEFLLVAIAGIAPILWMQLQRPFCIFSLLFLSLQPKQLTDDQRRLLYFFKSQESKLFSVVAATSFIAILWQLYQVAPLMVTVAPTLPGGRLGSLVVAAIASLLANLFLQVPISVLRVLWVSEATFAAAPPYPVERIDRDFTLVGLRVKRILPDLQLTPKPSVQSVPAMPEPLVADAVGLSEVAVIAEAEQWDEADNDVAEPEPLGAIDDGRESDKASETAIDWQGDPVTSVPQAEAEPEPAIASLELTLEEFDEPDADAVAWDDPATDLPMQADELDAEAIAFVEADLEQDLDSDVEEPMLSTLDVDAALDDVDTNIPSTQAIAAIVDEARIDEADSPDQSEATSDVEAIAEHSSTPSADADDADQNWPDDDDF